MTDKQLKILKAVAEGVAYTESLISVIQTTKEVETELVLEVLNAYKKLLGDLDKVLTQEFMESNKGEDSES